LQEVNGLLERYAPAAERTTMLQVALGDTVRWLESNGAYPRPAVTQDGIEARQEVLSAKLTILDAIVESVCAERRMLEYQCSHPADRQTPMGGYDSHPMLCRVCGAVYE